VKTKNKARVFIVDDHPLLRQGISAVLNQEPDMLVCGDADNAIEAMDAIERLQPDIAIVDLSLRNSNGLNLIKDLHIRCSRIPVIVLSMHSESFYAERALRAGARGYLPKEEGTHQLAEAIRRVLRGEISLSQSMASSLIKKVAGGQSSNSLEETLSDRELEVFELLGSGLGTRQIAERLHLSVKTVESHRENIKVKLQLTSGTDLVKHAVQWVQTETRSNL
jgi:DNA-binding NarL/FixJ family response regulator